MIEKLSARHLFSLLPFPEMKLFADLLLACVGFGTTLEGIAPPLFFLSVCVCSQVPMCVGCAHTCGGQRTISDATPQMLSTLLYEMGRGLFCQLG